MAAARRENIRRLGVMFLGGVALSVFATLQASAEWASTRIAVHVGHRPSATAPVVAHLKRGDSVRVLERQRGWGRISPFRPAKEEGLRGRKKVARWIQLRHLTDEQPIAFSKAACGHPNIAAGAFPKVGPGGLSRDEGAILCRGALHMLGSGKCARVEFGDKSISRPGSFFVNCGGANLFFHAEDLPEAP